ncbi:hypothetical protein NO2_1357 [Candidatus Termititenax persephonae]|uniref:Uncharacterized protein n=1 Tax=Candidatus Termititenax persephonae TaxID=2218525 RepID=A0A388TIS9_9BACT|nr:hypothetical protein NO2_1357 [Candidatus Termititenax persephonae]
MQEHQKTETLSFSVEDIRRAINEIKNEFNQNQKTELRQELGTAINELLAKEDAILENDQIRLGNESISGAELRAVGVSFGSTSGVARPLGAFGNNTRGAEWDAFGSFADRQRPNFNLFIIPAKLDIVNKDTGADKDTSVQPLRTQNVDRNNPEIHRAITEATISRTAWVEEPRPENGKIFDLDFGILSREIVQNIRQTSAQNSPEMHDTPMETLRDIYELTPEDIELFDGDYKKEALRLIQEDMQKRIQEAGGDENKGLMSFAEMVMHYPPNDGRFGQAGEPPDFSKWKGDFKVGFMMVGEELIPIKPVTNMHLTAANNRRTLLLKFEAEGVTYDISYNIADLDRPESLVESAGDEENPQLKINDVKVDTEGKTIIEYLMERHIHPDDMKTKFENVVLQPPDDYITGSVSDFSITYLNRLEFIARIGIKGDFTLNDTDALRIYRFRHESDDTVVKGDKPNQEYNGWLYTVTAGDREEPELRVLIPRTEGVNDIPIISGGNINMRNVPPYHRITDENGEVWMIATRSNVDNYLKGVGNANNPFVY